MGIFDKKSSTSNSTTASQTTPTAAGDESAAVGLGNISTGKYGKVDLGINLNMTDQGSVDAGKQLGLAAIDSGNLQTGKAFEVAAGVISAADRMHENNLVFTQSTIDDNANLFKWSQQQTAQTIDRAFASADKITRSDSTITSESLMKYGALAAVAVVAIIFLGKFVK